MSVPVRGAGCPGSTRCENVLSQRARQRHCRRQVGERGIDTLLFEKSSTCSDPFKLADRATASKKRDVCQTQWLLLVRCAGRRGRRDRN